MSAGLRAWVVGSWLFAVTMALAGWLGSVIGVYEQGQRLDGWVAALFTMGVWAAVLAVGAFTTAVTFAALAWIARAES